MKPGIHLRAYFLFLVFGTGMVLLVVRLVFLQIVDAPRLKELALRQYQTIFLPPRLRGRILDRNGELLATSIPTYSLALHPNWVEEEERPRLCAFLLRIAPQQNCRKLFSDQNFVWVRRHFIKEEYESLRSATRSFAPALEWIEESFRVYPKGDLAGQLLGFVGEDGRGLEGLEYALDKLLLPKPVEIPAYRDARRALFFDPGEISQLHAPPLEVVLTLDSDLQDEVEHILKDVCARTGAEQAQAVVVELPEGKIRSLALSHSFNPNDFRRYSPGAWRLRVATDIFEPGSTIKPFLYWSALKEGYPPWKLFYAEGGRWEVYNHTIRDDEPHGWLSLKEMLVVSSNIVAAKVGILLGREKLYENLRGFGFGERIGLSLPLEAPGILRPPKRWSSLELATISFGQGMGTTLLQLARAYARLASGNLSLDLKLVENPKEERSSPPFEDELTSPVKRISLATLKVLREVVEMGTGRRAMIPGLDIAGKTGTAQKADPQGGYAPDRYVALFVGVFPAESPRWVVAILVDEPKKEIYGGVVAAPVFREIALRIALKEGLLNQNPTSKVSSRSGLQREGRKKLKGVYDPELLLSQEDKIPDFKGVPLRLAGRIARSLGLIVIVEGKGFVHEQHPPPGAPLRKGTRLYLKLAEG